MGRIMAILFLLYGILALDQYVEQFRYWLEQQQEGNKRKRLRRKAIETNLMLYRHTGEEYYIERVRVLERSNRNERPQQSRIDTCEARNNAQICSIHRA